MALIRVDHPDVLRFIRAKKDMNDYNGFNFSVILTEDFMEKVKNKQDYDLVFNGKVYGRLNANDVFNEMIHYAWLNGEPGYIFIDRINKDNPTPHIGRMEAVNPCGLT